MPAEILLLNFQDALTLLARGNANVQPFSLPAPANWPTTMTTPTPEVPSLLVPDSKGQSSALPCLRDRQGPAIHWHLSRM